MEQFIDWQAEAASNLSAGFTYKETINMLSEKGLPRQDATEVVDELISHSRKKGLKEAGLGALIMLGGVVLLILSRFEIMEEILSEAGSYIFIPGIILLGDGIRRLGSLWLVTKK